MKKTTLLLLASAAAGTLTGCGTDKKAQDPQPGRSRSELLMAKTWSITAETETIGGKTRDVLAENYAACELDNTTSFLAGGIMRYDQGTVQCDADEPRTVTGNWALSEKDTKLTFIVAGFGNQGKIEELTESKMVLSQTETFNNQTVETRVTFAGR